MDDYTNQFLDSAIKRGEEHQQSFFEELTRERSSWNEVVKFHSFPDRPDGTVSHFDVLWGDPGGEEL